MLLTFSSPEAADQSCLFVQTQRKIKKNGFRVGLKQYQHVNSLLVET